MAWQLLVGDESALPAIGAILEQSAADLPAEVFLEVPSPEDIRNDVTAPPGSIVHWLPRTDAGAKPGTLALDAVKQARLPDGPFYAWAAGESSLATGIRRHLVGERCVAKSDISFRGYFSHGRASHPTAKPHLMDPSSGPRHRSRRWREASRSRGSPHWEDMGPKANEVSRCGGSSVCAAATHSERDSARNVADRRIHVVSVGVPPATTAEGRTRPAVGRSDGDASVPVVPKSTT
ncbi:SIP domain-containing protein [Streptomyces sp. NPDC091416]|uniref:SIP domain-containing protein n=1 Tax=Streptomyces sp. NPDC091416 TaxID=3366003 RepID=UPI0038276588